MIRRLPEGSKVQSGGNADCQENIKGTKVFEGKSGFSRNHFPVVFRIGGGAEEGGKKDLEFVHIGVFYTIKLVMTINFLFFVTKEPKSARNQRSFE